MKRLKESVKVKKKEVIFSVLLIVVLAAAAFSFTPFTGADPGPTTWTVHPDPTAGADFTSIQAAITNASPGDSIEVWNGTYTENVVVSRSLTIYARDGPDVTIVNASGSGSAITITADGCTIDGFTVTGSGDDVADAGIRVESTGNVITNNTCSENNHDGILLSSSSNNTISNNTCRNNNRYGFNILSSPSNRLSKNLCDHNLWGIKLEASSNNTLVENSCYENSIGIYLKASSNNRISNNIVYQNVLTGIYLSDSITNIFVTNTLMNNSIEGFHLANSSKNALLNNEIHQNFKGIYLFDSSGNLIYRNNFNNSYNTDSVNSDNFWNSSSSINYTYNSTSFTNVTGNYWHDYAGADNNTDGIGDLPHPVYEVISPGTVSDKDYYPLVQAFAGYTVENEPPIADFTFAPLEPFVNQSVTFDASSSFDIDGSIASYLWEFGDGNITNTNERAITHSFSSPLGYIVNLTVTDNENATGSTSTVITVRPLIFPVHNLDSGENFSAIQAAIDDADTLPGDIIEMDPETYTENVKVNKSLTIRSTSGDPTDTIVEAADTNKHVFEIIADTVNISGVTITGATETDKAGVYLNNSRFCDISDNNITDNYYGISLFNSNANSIAINTFSNSALWDIYIINSDGNNFADNTLSSYPTTITFTCAGDIALRGVTAPPADPLGLRNISKYVNATNISADPWLFLNVSYTDINLGSMEEPSLRMYTYNGTDWVLVPEPNSVNIEENYVYANITSFSIFAPMGVSLPPVYNVNTSENFTTIQDAIYDNDTQPGHIIEVRPGTYTENVIVNKSLIIQSSSGNPNNTIVQTNISNARVFNVTADNVTIRGFTVQGANQSYGIDLSSSNNTILNNIARNNYYHINLASSNSNVISTNSITNDIYIKDSVGVRLSSSGNNTISDNYFTKMDYSAIRLDTQSNHNIITRNTAINNKRGLMIYPSTGGGGNCNIVTENNFYGNTQGINIFGIKGPGDNNVIANNSITFSTNWGLHLEESKNNIIENNDFSHTQTAECIRILGLSSNNTINNNTANYAGLHGISLWTTVSGGTPGSPNNNTITNNNLSCNRYHGIQVSWDSRNNTMANNTATFNAVGGVALFRSSSDNIIANNNLSSNLFGLSIIPIGGSHPTNNQITNNVITQNRAYGIWLSNLHDLNDISTNTILNNELFGFLIADSTNNSIRDNTANFNQKGFVLDEASSIQLLNNTANLNEISGFSLILSTNNTLLGNTARFNTYEGIYLSNSSENNISNNDVSGSPDLKSYFGISLYQSSNNNTIRDNDAGSNYYFEVFNDSSCIDNDIDVTPYPQRDIITGVRVYVAETFTPSLQSVDNTTNATYYIMVENLGNMTETFVLVNSSTDEPDVQSLDADSVTLDAGESSGRVVGDKFETLKLNVSASTPGVYRVDVDATSSFDATVKDSIETWTIVQGEVGSVTKINATIIDSALIDSSITDSTVTNSAINNSIISGSTITNSIIKDSEVVGTPLSDVMLEDAVVTNGKIASGTITLYSSPGITFVITREIPISTLLIGSDYRNSDLVGLKYVTSDKSLSVSGDNSGTGFDIYARDDYFAGSLSAQRSTIPPFGFKELDYNIGGYVFVAPSKNVESSTDLVTIKLYYDPALSQELINRLTIMYYNEQAGKWQPIAVSGINLIEKYVYGKVPHWSVFALMAQTPTPSGPSGPGVFAGGGGAAPSVPGEMTIPIANPGTNIFHFEVLGLDVLTVSINLESTTFKAKVAMESTDKPVGIPDCPGTAYSYFDISTNLEAENINAATINFRVSKSWALINGVDSIRMYRYANGWQELKTLKITEDDEYIYFAAETPGLSLFVISSEEKGVEIAPPATPTPTLIPATPAPTPIPPAEPLLGTRMIAILVAIAALAIVSVAYLMLRRRRP